jgi:hypothetical protein
VNNFNYQRGWIVFWKTIPSHWAEQQQIEFQARHYLRNIIRIITETGLRVYKELMSMTKDQADLENVVVWIPDSKTANGVAEVPLTEIASRRFGISGLDVPVAYWVVFGERLVHGAATSAFGEIRILNGCRAGVGNELEDR